MNTWQRTVLLVTVLGMLVTQVALAAPPTYDIRGTWTYVSNANGSEYTSAFTISTLDCASGAFTGSGAGNGYTFPVSGTLDGASWSSTDGPYDQLPSYTGYTTGTLTSADALTGSFTDSGGQSGSVTMTRTGAAPAGGCTGGGSPSPSPSPSPSASPGTGTLRPTAVQMMCTYVVATSQHTCTASVADAGPTPVKIPAGAVKFSSPKGVFSAGDTCQLQSSQTAPAIPSCSVAYLSAASGITVPDITAAYQGSTVHAASAGATKFLILGGPTNYETRKPGSLTVKTNVPVDGTQVTACAAVSGSAKAKASGELDDVIKRQQGNLEQQLKSIDQANAQMQQTLARIRELQAQMTAAGSDVAKIKQLQNQINTELDDARQLREVNAKNCRSAIGQISAVASAKKPRRSPITVLGSVRKPNAKAGPLTLALKLKAQALRKAARGKKTLSVYVRVTMILPSGLIKGGVPYTVMQKLKVAVPR